MLEDMYVMQISLVWSNIKNNGSEIGLLPSMESMALFDEISGVHEENLKCAVCNG